MSVTVQDRIHFAGSFLRSPRTVGSFIPSSDQLTAAMVRPIDFASARMIVELGAGSGVFTQRIASATSPGTRVLVYERDEAMRARLQAVFASLEFHPDALDLAGTVGPSCADAVVCSLPFANFARETRARLAQDIHDVLKPGGSLIAVQYSTQMRRALTALFGDVSLSFVARNVPPAFVYTCTKRR
jgi:phospholipid N-methyltransferase